MKKPFIFLFILSLSITCIRGSQVDSLKTLLQNSKDDTLKVNALLQLSKSYFGSSPDDAINYAEQAQALSLKLNFKKGIAFAFKNKGIARYNQGKYVDAIDDWQQSLAVFDSIGDKVGVANMQSNLGVIYNNQGENTKALEYDVQALKTAEQLNDTLRMATVMQNIGIVYLDKKTELNEALKYLHMALPYAEKLGDKDLLGAINVNIGEAYFKEADDQQMKDRRSLLYDSALFYFQKSVHTYDENSENLPYPLNYIGKLYVKKTDFAEAIKYHQLAFDKAKKLDSKLDMAQSLIGLAEADQAKGDIRVALATYKQAEPLAMDVNAHKELKDIYEGLGLSYAKLSDFSNAFKYQTLLIGIKDTLYNIEADKKLGTIQFRFDLDKKQGQVDLLTKDQELKAKEISRQKIVRNGFIGGFAVVLLFAGIFFTQRNRISKEKKRSEELLLNILPAETAEELKATGAAKAKSFDSVTVMFTDFKNFTQASEKLSAEELVNEINYCYSEFDKIVTRHGIEKIKTIGDSYMCAGGLPVANNTHASDIVTAGLEMVQFIAKNKKERVEKGMPYFELRCGIHTGQVVAGIVGIKKFAYDIWGDTVNTASRMESSGEVGKVNVSGSTYAIIKDQFVCTHRGKIEAKNKGMIDMYFVEKRMT